jgi:transposase
MCVRDQAAGAGGVVHICRESYYEQVARQYKEKKEKDIKCRWRGGVCVDCGVILSLSDQEWTYGFYYQRPVDGLQLALAVAGDH